MNMKRSSILKAIMGIGCIPVGTLLISLFICMVNGVVMFQTSGHWEGLFRSVTVVMLTTFALSINLNSGRFDFSIGSVALVSSVISATVCIKYELSTPYLLLISLAIGILLGVFSGLLYILIKLPPIIVSLGVALFYEGFAFHYTKGYGVSFVTNMELTSFPGIINYIFVIVIALGVIIYLFDYTKFGYDYKALMSGQKVSVNTGIREKWNAVICYGISGGLMGVVGFLNASNTGNIQMALNFGSIGIMFTAFLPMFIGSFIGRFCNEKIGYLLGAVTTGLLSMLYARLNLDSSIQQITTALILVGFLIYLNNEGKLITMLKKLYGGKNEV